MRNRNIVTYTGRLFDFWEPTPETICIEDIAHALALTNRYGGHTHTPYSVAEHCVRMSYPELPGDPLTNLLHDAAEAYVGDIASPQKQHLFFGTEFASWRSFYAQEYRILRTICIALDVPFNESQETKQADLIMLATEVRDLMPITAAFDSWLGDVEPLEAKIKPVGWILAEDQFLARFEELKEMS